MNCFGLTDRGVTRQENQDSFLIEDCEKASCSILALCDGMGGANAGGLASELSAKAFVNHVYHHLSTFPTRISDYPRVMSDACDEANGVAYAYSQFGDHLTGMGTTLVAAVLRRNGTGYVLNVGDSRAYQMHRRSLKQISRDHSLVEELVEAGIINAEQARHHPQKNVITRALGSDKEVEADIFSVNLTLGDSLLLCSDGLSNIVPEEEIAAVLMDSDDAESACRDLMELALSRGAPDNVTIIVWKR
ncbi:MAG: Stp1/IreP family PP2C-type Ser/Thr phosphatase [Oscillospiraceae bacterium]|nr:Stp1/IreP family PP2C-type Ser/Thr phosphatase [Oscillospiraceae bacterium]